MGFFGKNTDQFLGQKILRDIFGGLYAIKRFLDIDKTRPVLERPFKI